MKTLQGGWYPAAVQGYLFLALFRTAWPLKKKKKFIQHANQFLHLYSCTAPSSTALCWSSYHVKSPLDFLQVLTGWSPVKNEFVASKRTRLSTTSGLHIAFKPYMDQFIFEIALPCLKHSSIIAFLSVWPTGGPCSVDGIFPLTDAEVQALQERLEALMPQKLFFCLPQLKFGVLDVFLNSCGIMSWLMSLPWAVVHMQRTSVLLNPNISC